jgi:hypothetical protein
MKVWLYTASTGVVVHSIDRCGCTQHRQVWLYTASTGVVVHSIDFFDGGHTSIIGCTGISKAVIMRVNLPLASIIFQAATGGKSRGSSSSIFCGWLG